MVKNTPVNSLHAGFDLFDLILYIPVNNFSVMLGQVFLGWASTKLGLMCHVSLSKKHLSKLSTGSTQEDPSLFNWKIVDGM